MAADANHAEPTSCESEPVHGGPPSTADTSRLRSSKRAPTSAASPLAPAITATVHTIVLAATKAVDRSRSRELSLSPMRRHSTPRWTATAAGVPDDRRLAKVIISVEGWRGHDLYSQPVATVTTGAPSGRPAQSPTSPNTSGRHDQTARLAPTSKCAQVNLVALTPSAGNGAEGRPHSPANDPSWTATRARLEPDDALTVNRLSLEWLPMESCPILDQRPISACITPSCIHLLGRQRERSQPGPDGRPGGSRNPRRVHRPVVIQHQDPVVHQRRVRILNVYYHLLEQVRRVNVYESLRPRRYVTREQI
ncbi:hypothetical protein C8D89_11972 [Actinomycetospora cinnamomea]|uniref:Uncharacterized protein n=1 Tax=Actinomycetospora cinnamomea TaxID=663609 RepID=A0A2U1EVJ4_9PSEU|nr:hypothetical protein C8D89_11972 [Actinomycetospora cinnamomea]